MDFAKTTEQDSHYNNLEQKTIRELLETINNEDQSVPKAVAKVLPQIERLVKKVTEQLHQGGRLFYIGAGTSGRLGILDASECPPTFGVRHDLVIGLEIASIAFIVVFSTKLLPVKVKLFCSA